MGLRMRLLRIASYGLLALGTLALLLVPTEAHAWGPLAHLSFSNQALANLHVVQPAMRSLLLECSNEFLYGSLAADIIVGKNLARYLYHCHNWKVGFNVLRQAKPGAEQAFALGFLAHLSADTVAHNYYVPFKTVSSFDKRNTRHAYWELRYDQKMDGDMWRVAKRISVKSYREHDELLRRTLAGAHVLPFAFSRQLFNSLLLSARIKRFQRFTKLALARHKNLVLEDDLVAETEKLATNAILGMLVDGEKCRAATADPTGGRNLKMAHDMRRKLAQRTRERKLELDEAKEIAQASRASFRKAIHGKLVLPELA
jgi:hypothetical protein